MNKDQIEIHITDSEWLELEQASYDELLVGSNSYNDNADYKIKLEEDKRLALINKDTVWLGEIQFKIENLH